jgi:hypothetical protein
MSFNEDKWDPLVLYDLQGEMLNVLAIFESNISSFAHILDPKIGYQPFVAH